MGCDIHIYIEYKRSPNLPWEADEHHTPDTERCEQCFCCQAIPRRECDNPILWGYKTARGPRNYNVFGKLASVRGTSDQKPRGFPGDASDIVKDAFSLDGIDGHSHSYMNIDEFARAVETAYIESKYSTRHNFSDPFGIDLHAKPIADERNRRYPDYTDIINYCNKLKEDKSIDKVLFDKDVTSEVQVRLVFWFDN